MDTKKYFEDIICARATPAGGSAIAVIRVSGKDSHSLLSRIFVRKNSTAAAFKTHRAYYGTITDGDELIDDILVITFADGKSFTGEESFEINCHGSEIVIALILRLICRNGGRLAEPGEFSKRAFLNGKIDLSEAEAIMDVVNASTKQAAGIAVKQLNGRVRTEIDTIKNKIADLLAAVEVYIDYPEEDLSLDTQKWADETLNIRNSAGLLLDGFVRGRFYREGINAAILGKTNAGKSTFFNFMLNEDKAIVSDIHGTTRDYLDGVINVAGYGVRVYDTAGLRMTDDPIEKEGTKRAIEISDKADIIIYVIGSNYGITENDIGNILSIKKDKKVIIVINKTDLLEDNGAAMTAQIESQIGTSLKKHRTIGLSALNKTGADAFNKAFLELVTDSAKIENTDPVITNERHALLIKDAIEYLNNAYEKFSEEYLDLAAFELRESLDKLGEITGEITPEDILNKIFSSFCIGK